MKTSEKYKQKSEGEEKEVQTNEGMSEKERERPLLEVEDTLLYLFIFTQSRNVSK